MNLYVIFVVLVILFIGLVLVVTNQKRMAAQNDKVNNWLDCRFAELGKDIQRILEIQCEESTLTCQGCTYHQSSLGIADENFDQQNGLTDVVRKHYCKRYQNDCRDATTDIKEFPRRRYECVRSGCYKSYH